MFEGRNKTPLRKSETAEANELRILSEGLEAIVQEMKALKDDFDLVRSDVRTIEKHLRHQKAGKARHGKKDVPEEREDENQDYPEEVEKAARELTVGPADGGTGSSGMTAVVLSRASSRT